MYTAYIAILAEEFTFCGPHYCGPLDNEWLLSSGLYIQMVAVHISLTVNIQSATLQHNVYKFNHEYVCDLWTYWLVFCNTLCWHMAWLNANDVCKNVQLAVSVIDKKRGANVYS